MKSHVTSIFLLSSIISTVYSVFYVRLQNKKMCPQLKSRKKLTSQLWIKITIFKIREWFLMLWVRKELWRKIRIFCADSFVQITRQFLPINLVLDLGPSYVFFLAKDQNITYINFQGRKQTWFKHTINGIYRPCLYLKIRFILSYNIFAIQAVYSASSKMKANLMRFILYWNC